MANRLFLQLKKLGLKNKIASIITVNLCFIFLLSSMSLRSNAQSYIQLGSGTGTNSYFPLYYLYDYSYTQTIYTAAEMNAQGALTAATITKIYYKPTASVSTSNWKDWVIYMGNTTQAGFSSTTNYIPVANMTEVFNGQILANTMANTWIEINLATPFNWDGTSNIVVAVDENTMGWGSSPNWAGYTLAPSSGSKGIYFYQDNNNISPSSPSATSSGTTNNVAQIRFDGTLLPSCTGTPNAGTVPATIGICPGQPLTLVDTGSTSGQSNISGQWQSSPSGQNTWTNITGATTPTYTMPSAPAVATDFRYSVTCSAPGGTTAYSNTMVGTITPANQCYCAPTNTNSTYYLNNFATTGGITNITNNNSGLSPNGYGNFYNQYQVSQLPGSSINFTGSFGSSSSYSFGVKIWVDWNQNGSFNDPGELMYTTTSYITALTGSFTVPATAALGDTRMRIGVDYLSSTGPTDPCQNNNTYQEFEDYKFTVVALQSCTNATFPTSVNTTSNKDTLCLVGDVSLNISPLMPPVSGLTYQWQQASNAAGPYTNIGSAQATPAYVATNVSTETYFRVNVICNNNTTVLTSNPKHIVISDPQLLGVTDGQRCGPGTVNLSATSGGNSTIFWYENPTGGPLLSNGSTFTTPFLNQTDTFYASAGAGGGGGSGTDSLNSMNGGGNGCGGGVMFDLIAINTFNIDSFKANAYGSGSNIKIYYKNGTYVGSETNQSAWTLHETVNMSYGSGYINIPLTNPLPVNAGDTVAIYINYYSGYANGNGANQIITNNDMTFKAGVGLCSDFGGTNNPRVFDGRIYYGSGSCESPRQAVVATINPVPDVNLGPNVDTCVDPGSSITLDAGTYPNSPSYLWQNGTVNQTRQVSTSGSYSVIVTNSFGCSGYDTVQVNIKPNPIVDLGPDTTICEGEVLELDAGPGPNAVAYFWNTGVLSRTLFVDHSGTYSVLVTNSQGCVKSDTINVTISGHIPTSDGIAVTNLGPKTFNFKAQNATGVVSYDWDFGDGSPHSFGSNPTHTYEHVGNYLVKLKISGSCGQINDSAYVYIVGINDISNDAKSILLYPNPAQNIVQVQVADELTMNKITIINTLGQKVYEQGMQHQNHATISLHGFASGLYTIQVETNKGMINKKLEILK